MPNRKKITADITEHLGYLFLQLACNLFKWVLSIGKMYEIGRTQRSAPTDVGLPDVIKNIKTYTTTRYIHGVREHHWQPFYKRLWQRGYYERIIRNSNDLNKVREYIINNPMTWHLRQK